jgi:hypothetical protein
MAQRDESTKAKDEAKREIGSVEAARRMLNMKHMDPHKIVTNHAEQVCQEEDAPLSLLPRRPGSQHLVPPA